MSESQPGQHVGQTENEWLEQIDAEALKALSDKRPPKDVLREIRQCIDVWRREREIPASGRGLTAVAARSLAYALNDIPKMVAVEMAWLDTGHLRQLARAAQVLHDSAVAERDSRPPR